MNRSKRAIGGFLLLLLTNAWTWSLGLIEIAYIPRRLGDVNYGKLYLAGAIISAASVVVTFGGGSYIVRTVASNRDAANRFLCAVLSFRTLVGVPLIIAIYFAMRWANHDPLVLSLIAITGLNVYLGWMADAIATFRQAQTNFKTLAKSQMMGKAVGVFSRIMFVRGGYGTVGAAWGDTIQQVVGIAAAWFSRASKISIVRVRRSDFVTLIRAGWPYFQYNFYLWVYGAPTTAYMLVAWDGYPANGWFSVANRVLGLFYLFPGMLTGVLMPLLVNAYEDSKEEYLNIARRALSPALVIAIPFSLLLVLRADALTHALRLGGSFQHVPLILQIAGGDLLFRWASTFYGMLLIVSNRVNKQARAAMFAAPTNLALTAALVIAGKRYIQNGAAGAMLAAELTEIMVVIIYARALRDQNIVPANLSAIGRGLIAGIVPAAIYLVFPMHNRLAFAGVTVLGIAAFFPAALFTGALRKDDLSPIMQAVRAKVQSK